MSAPTERQRREAVALDRVRRRVTAIGFFAVASHGVFALIGVSFVLVDQGRRGDAMLLTIMSGLVALVVCAGTRAILGARPVSARWFAASLVPTAAALVWLT
jgi:hypothetical protein